MLEGILFWIMKWIDFYIVFSIIVSMSKRSVFNKVMEQLMFEALQKFIFMAKIDYNIIHFTYITYQRKTTLSIKYNLHIVLKTHLNCT